MKEGKNEKVKEKERKIRHYGFFERFKRSRKLQQESA
jgi:hypothetical protein